MLRCYCHAYTITAMPFSCCHIRYAIFTAILLRLLFSIICYIFVALRYHAIAAYARYYADTPRFLFRLIFCLQMMLRFFLFIFDADT